MLSERVKAVDSLSTEERDAFLLAELITEGYLDGEIIENAAGIPVKVPLSLPTVKGRLFLQELKEKEFAKSLAGRIKHLVSGAVGFVLGILTALIVEILKNVLVKH